MYNIYYFLKTGPTPRGHVFSTYSLNAGRWFLQTKKNHVQKKNHEKMEKKARGQKWQFISPTTAPAWRSLVFNRHQLRDKKLLINLLAIQS